MRIAELAERSGVKVSTVRFYERRGVVPSPDRGTNGYRRYDAEDVRRVRFLRRGQELGFTLAELAGLVAFPDQPGVLPADEVADFGHAKLTEIDDRIADLQRMREALAGLLDAQCIEPDAPCPIIAALADGEGVPPDFPPTARHGGGSETCL